MDHWFFTKNGTTNYEFKFKFNKKDDPMKLSLPFYNIKGQQYCTKYSDECLRSTMFNIKKLKK